MRIRFAITQAFEAVPKKVGEGWKLAERHNIPRPKRNLAEIGTGDQQSIEHPGLGFITSGGPGAHFHSANRLLGAVIGLADARIVEEGGVSGPILTDADQQV